MDSGETIMYLSANDVRVAFEEIDPLACIHEVLCAHSSGRTRLPNEAYLSWHPEAGGEARSLNMPGMIDGDQPVAGTKIINANTANPEYGQARAHGLTLLFDITTARPLCVMEGAYISGLRTAAVSVLAVQHLARPPVLTVGLLGAGAVSAEHARLFSRRIPEVQELRIYDIVPGRAASLCQRLAAEASMHGVNLRTAESARAAVLGADVVVACTTTRRSYIERLWLAPGVVVVNVSLDDLSEEIMLTAEQLYIDDWNLIYADEFRLLGRLAHAGKVLAPGVRGESPGTRSVTGTLGDLLLGKCSGRLSDEDVVVVNPFGLSVEDLALARRVYQVAQQRKLGLLLAS